MQDTYDVVVGGGAAGLSGALALGRACGMVLVVDGGLPRNAPGPAMHNSAAVAINSDLITEDTRRAVEARREGPFSAAAERELCEQVLGDRRHGS